MNATVIIPFHRNLAQLSLSLSAARASLPGAEILVAADGAVESSHALAAEHGARVLDLTGPRGPAAARNRAADQAAGDVLIFVDADVVAARDALAGMCRMLDEQPSVAAVFGAYDLHPREPNFMSQFKNLSHAYVHEIAPGEASTFWAGLGAIRTTAFRSVGGFDERFRRPSVEDIDLGYRLIGRGHAIRLDPRFRGCHLKRWSLASSIVTDLQARGIPWTQLIHRSGPPRNGLNLSLGLRLSVVVSYLALLAMTALLFSAQTILWATTALAAWIALIALNFGYYRWLSQQRGPWFGIRAVPAHFIHHLCNGVSFVVGTALYVAGRGGWAGPGVLPHGAWTGAVNPPDRSAARRV